MALPTVTKDDANTYKAWQCVGYDPTANATLANNINTGITAPGAKLASLVTDADGTKVMVRIESGGTAVMGNTEWAVVKTDPDGVKTATIITNAEFTAEYTI